MRENEIVQKLEDWNIGGPDGPLGKWVDAVFDGTSTAEASQGFKDKIVFQKNLLHALFKDMAEHDHGSKEDLLRACYALLLFPEIKIPQINDVSGIRDIAKTMDPRLREFVARTKLIDILGKDTAFVNGLHIDENEAKNEGASQRFWVNAFYSMSVSAPLALTRGFVMTSPDGNVAQSALMVGQVLHDIAAYLNAKPKIKHEDMGGEIARLTGLFDDYPDEKILNTIGFDASAWNGSWAVASQGNLGVVREQLVSMGIRIATMVPDYWLFSRGYRLPIETVKALEEYRDELAKGITAFDSLRNAARWVFTSIPARTDAVVEQERQLIEGILRCNRLGFLNLRTIQQFDTYFPDAIRHGDSQTQALHKLAKKAIRRELYKKAQLIPGPGVHIDPAHPVIVRLRAELKRKDDSIPSVGKGGNGPTQHMLLYGVLEGSRTDHIHSHACGRAQKRAVYRFIDEQNNLGALTIKSLLDLLAQMCCFEWKLGCQKSPFPTSIPANATLVKDQIIYWVITQLCIIAGDYGEKEFDALRDATRLTQRDGVQRYIREQYNKKTLELDNIKELIKAMSWYTWDAFIDEPFVTWMPINGSDKLVEQVRQAEASQFEPIRDYIIGQSCANTLSMTGLRAEVEKSSWYIWEKLKTQPRIEQLPALAGDTVFEQVESQIYNQLSGLFCYIKAQQVAQTLSITDLEAEVSKLAWYSWDEFKRHGVVELLDVHDAQAQIIAEIDKQDASKRADMRA